METPPIIGYFHPWAPPVCPGGWKRIDHFRSKRTPAMTIDVRCYSCGAAYSVSDDNAGKKLRCSTCQTVVTIPSRPHTVAEGFNVRDIAAASATPVRQPQSGTATGPPSLPETSAKPAGGSKVGIIIAAVGGGVVLLAGLIVGIVFAVKAADSDGDGKKKDDDRDRGATGFAAGNGGDGRAGVTPVANGGGRRNGFQPGTGNSTYVYNEHLRWIRSFRSRLDSSAYAAGRVASRNSAVREARVIERVAADLETIVRGAEQLARPTVTQQRLLKARLETELSRHRTLLRTYTRSSGWRTYRNEPALQRASRRMDAVIRRARAVYR